MRYHATLDDILGSRLKVRILRLFCRTVTSYTGREVASLTAYSHTQALTVLEELVRNGLLRRIRVGAAYSYSLNEEHILVKKLLLPAFDLEYELLAEVATAFKEGMGDDLVSLKVFGSVARGEERPDSDLDLILEIRDEADPVEAEEKAIEIASEAMIAFGNFISPVVIPSKQLEAKRRAKTKRGMWKEVFGGQPMVELSLHEGY